MRIRNWLKKIHLPWLTGKTDKKNRERSHNGETCILDHIERVVEDSQKYGIDKCLSKSAASLAYIGDKLGVTPLQAVLFSHFIERSADNSILISEIAESVNCSATRIIKYMNDCDALAQKRLIRCRSERGRTAYRVPTEVRDSLRKNNRYVPEPIDNLSIGKFFVRLKRLFEERENSELSFEEIKLETRELLNANMQLVFCQRALSYDLIADDLLLLLCVCHLWVNAHDDNLSFHDVAFLYDDDDLEMQLTRDALSDGSHLLLERKFIEYNNSKGFVNTESFRLSGYAKKELLPEIKGAEPNYKKDLTLCESITAKHLFYNEKESASINALSSLLQEENYRKITDRLDAQGMHKGFACLFSGAPGTGKTETAYQIARQTKRNLMVINIAETKSMWYGESEKKMKEIFDTYRVAVDNSGIAPILLFNEADGIIGKRKALGGNQSIDETENRIQNIILQEVENLSGILIATTNLTENMDKAFERRFLYKIEFAKPSKEIRSSIWMSLIPDLVEEDAAVLAARFDLSGGQIENIARKRVIDFVLRGKAPELDALMGYCRDELAGGMEKRLGFGV